VHCFASYAIIYFLLTKKESRRKDRIRQSDETGGLPSWDKIVPFIVCSRGGEKEVSTDNPKMCTKYNTSRFITAAAYCTYMYIMYIYTYIDILRECALARSLIYTVKFGRQFGFKSAAAADLSLILLRFLFICARAKLMASG